MLLTDWNGRSAVDSDFHDMRRGWRDGLIDHKLSIGGTAGSIIFRAIRDLLQIHSIRISMPDRRTAATVDHCKYKASVFFASRWPRGGALSNHVSRVAAFRGNACHTQNTRVVVGVENPIGGPCQPHQTVRAAHTRRDFARLGKSRAPRRDNR